MVGVAGRSRGCKTCRRRRVKCDEQHPTCKRCEKAGYTCEGYQDRNFIIFDNTIKHENAIQSYKSSPKHTSTNSASSAASSDTSSVSARDFSSITPESVSAELVKFENRSPLWKCNPWNESPSLDREELYSSFMWKYFYRGAESRLKLFRVPGADLNVRSSLAHMSSQALSTSFFGFRTGSQDIMIEGQRLYGSALLHLNHALSHRSPKDDCDVLAAIVMLCLFEFLMPASITGWISHALGLGGMFRVLGPELCSQYPYHTYFETCRLLIIYAHLILRLDPFLADKKWLTIPWLTRVEGKTCMEEISDVLTQLCRVQCYWDDVVKQREQAKRDKFQLRYQKQLALCFRELQNWASRHKGALEAKRTVMPYRALGSILDDKEKPKSKATRSPLIQEVYSYPNLETANLLCLYHGIYILLTIMVHNPPPPTFVGLYPPPSPPPPADSPIHTAFLASGLEIAKSTDFHLLETHDSAGSFHLVFPMRMCARAFEEIRMKDEDRWANGVLTSIARGSNRQWAFAGQIVRENGRDVHQFRK